MADNETRCPICKKGCTMNSLGCQRGIEHASTQVAEGEQTIKQMLAWAADYDLNVYPHPGEDMAYCHPSKGRIGGRRKHHGGPVRRHAHHGRKAS